ncbi:MAG: isochorismatase family protein [Kiritimatiellia bacterium]|nr:isochorismatase family protein [Kiritimatiellia bacterium]
MLELKTYKLVCSTGGGSSEESVTELQTVNKKTDLSKTALVCLDLWDGLVSPQAPCMKNTTSLIGLARKYNIPVIHVPHLPWERYAYNWSTWREGEPIVGFMEPGWKWGEPVIGRSAKALPANPYAMMDSILKERGINTLLYTGYSIQWCMLGRLNAMDAAAKRGSYEPILVKDCTDPNDSNHTQWAHDFFETKFTTTTLGDIAASLGDTEFQALPSLRARSYVAPETPKPNLDFGKGFAGQGRFPKTAIVVINAWDSHPNKGWERRMRENNGRIAELIEWARGKGMIVVHVPNSEKADPRCRPMVGEKIVVSELELESYLVARGFPMVAHICPALDYSVIYVGNLMNTTARFNGVTEKNWYPNNGDYHYYPAVCGKYVMEDCIIHFESPESYPMQAMKNQFLIQFAHVNSGSIVNSKRFVENVETFTKWGLDIQVGKQ